MWLDGGGINHQGGRGQGVLPVASGRTERGFSFSELDASRGHGDLNDLRGDADKSMTSSPAKKQPQLVYKAHREEGGSVTRERKKNLGDVWLN